MGAGGAMITVRDCAQEIIRATEASAGDLAALAASIGEPLRRLMARPDLTSIGVPRQGNNVAQSWYLYLDDRMSILLFEVPGGKGVQPHDHGVWESLFVYRGRLRHRVYERADDGARPGRAELRVIEDRVMAPGDLTMVAPPADIHGFAALDPESFGITVVDGFYKPDRHYYRPEEGTYEVRRPRSIR